MRFCWESRTAWELDLNRASKRLLDEIYGSQAGRGLAPDQLSLHNLMSATTP
jgi:hypothetical protein